MRETSSPIANEVGGTDLDSDRWAATVEISLNVEETCGAKYRQSTLISRLEKELSPEGQKLVGRTIEGALRLSQLGRGVLPPFDLNATLSEIDQPARRLLAIALIQACAP